MTQLALNFMTFEIIKVSPFVANLGREFNLFKHRQPKVMADVATSHVKTLKKIHENIMKMQQRFANYVN